MKQKSWTALGLLLLLALVVTACGARSSTSEDFPKNADGYADISVQQLAGMLEDKDLTLVNVHIPYEGEIPQTGLFIAYDEIDVHLDQLPGKDAPIVLYCRSGSMSTSAAQELVELGYTNIMEVDGGFNAWKAAGYQLLNKNQ
jgi:rhodanese-related sulfurtransferase